MEARDDIGKFIQVGGSPGAAAGKDLGADAEDMDDVGEQIAEPLTQAMGAQPAQLRSGVAHAGQAFLAVAL